VFVRFDHVAEKGNLSYLAIIRRCATVEAEFQIVAGVGLPSKKE